MSSGQPLLGSFGQVAVRTVRQGLATFFKKQNTKPARRQTVADRCASHARSDHDRVPRGLGAGIGHADYTIFPILLDLTDLASPWSSLLGSPRAPRLRPAFRDAADPQERKRSLTFSSRHVCFARSLWSRITECDRFADH